MFHIEAGARRFIDLARAIAGDLGTTPARLKPYLRSWYNGARDMMEDSDIPVDGMDTAETVRTILQSGAIDSLSAAELPQGPHLIPLPHRQRRTAMAIDLGRVATKAMREANPPMFRRMVDAERLMPVVREICAKAKDQFNLVPPEQTADWMARQEMAAEWVRVAATEMVSQETDPVTTAFPPAG